MSSLPRPFASANLGRLTELAAIVPADPVRTLNMAAAEPMPSVEEQVWWARESAYDRRVRGGGEWHTMEGPPAGRHHVEYLPWIAGKPLVGGHNAGPWCVIDGEFVHSAWPTPQAAWEAIKALRIDLDWRAYLWTRRVEAGFLPC